MRMDQDDRGVTCTTTTTNNNTNNNDDDDNRSSKEDRIFASRHDLDAFQLLDQPLWIFDIVKRAMWYANPAAVELWNAPHLEALLARDFGSDMSDTTAHRLDDYLLQFSRDKRLRIPEQWTYYPNQQSPKTVHVTQSGVCIEEGRIAMLCQAEYRELILEEEEDDDDDNDEEDTNEATQQEEENQKDTHENQKDTQDKNDTKTTNTANNNVHNNSKSKSNIQKKHHNNNNKNKQAAQEALRSVEMMRHLPVPVALFDLQGNLVEQNPQARAVLGMTDKKKPATCNASTTTKTNDAPQPPHAPTGASAFCKRFVDPHVGPRILQQVAAAHIRSEQVIRFQAHHYTVHGEQWADIQVRPTTDPVTSEPMLLFTASDIPTNNHNEQQGSSHNYHDHHNHQANHNDTNNHNDNEDWVAEMAHTLRTPLHHVVGVVELILQKCQQSHTNNNGTKTNTTSTTTTAQEFPLLAETKLLQHAAQILISVLQDIIAHVSGGRTSINHHPLSSSYQLHQQPYIPYIPNNTTNNTNNTSNNYDHLNRSGHCAGRDKPPTLVPRCRNNHNNHHTHPVLQLEHKPCSIHTILQASVATMMPHATAKQLTLQLENTHNNSESRSSPSSSSSSSLSDVMGDAGRLSQVLFELLHNAIKYTSTGGIVVSVSKVQSRSRRVRLRFQVQDTGVGMNLEQQQQLVQAKDRNNNSNNDNNSSTSAVGISLCKSIVEAMGGTMGIDSKPGRGSTVWFEVPFLRATAERSHRTSCTTSTKNTTPPQRKRRSSKQQQPQQHHQHHQESIPEVPTDGGLQILLVDQDTAGRNITKTLLEQCGHSVTTADHGDAMVCAVREDRDVTYDVVLLETQQLPTDSSNLSALEAVWEIRLLGYSMETLPILALTAGVPPADYYPELGLSDWLIKPVLIRDIQTAMTNAICNVGGGGSVGTDSLLDGDSISLSTRSISVPERNSNATVPRSTEKDVLHGSHPNVGLNRHSVKSDTSPNMPKRRSFDSIQSALSIQLAAAASLPAGQAGSKTSFVRGGSTPATEEHTCSNTDEDPSDSEEPARSLAS